ncbi:nuclear division cycle 1 [Augochlora pura]
MLQTNKKGYKELLMQRMFLAIISTIVIQFFLISTLLLITNLNTNYESWLQSTWTAITSFRMWSFFCNLATVTFFQGLICSKNFSNNPPYMKSRFAKFCKLLTSQNILMCVLHVISGGLLVWLHLLVKGDTYNFLTTECKIVYGTCLIEEQYILFLSGFWIGLYFFFKTSSFRMNYLKFPIISLSKMFQFKTKMYSILPSLMVKCTWPVLYYLIAYYFLGFYCRSIILFLTSAQLENEPLSSITNLLSLSLIFQLWLYHLTYVLTIETMYLLFNLYLTEWVPFDLKQSHTFSNDDNGISLPEALSMVKISIMQQLGYLDLVTMAQKEKSRRGVLFTLSQPGGHPYNWNCIVEKCTDLIKKFSNDINTACTKAQEPFTPYAPTTTVLTKNTAIQKEYVYRMRNLVTAEPPVAAQQDEIKQYVENELFIQKFIKTKWNNFLTYLLSKPLIAYIFGEIEGGQVCYILYNGQSVIWAAEAISSLAVHSLNEDSYGIVQKDLPLIINTLFGLKQTLDKLQKSNIMTKKHEDDDQFIKQIFQSLCASTKRSIYRIVINFEAYIEDLALEPAVVEHLNNFLLCRE